MSSATQKNRAKTTGGMCLLPRRQENANDIRKKMMIGCWYLRRLISDGVPSRKRKIKSTGQECSDDGAHESVRMGRADIVLLLSMIH